MRRWAGRQDAIKSSYWQRVWGLVYPWLVYEGIMTLLVSIFSLFLFMTRPALFENVQGLEGTSSVLNKLVQENYLLISLLGCAIVIPLLLLFMKNDRRKEEREAFRLEKWQTVGPAAFLLCIVCGISACIVLNHVLLYSGLYGLLESGFEESAQALYRGNLLFEMLTVGVLIPLAEEIIFRGLIYRRIRWYLDPLPAILISSLLFAIMHGNWLQGIYSFMIGALLAFVYERTHSLLAPLCVHAGANLISVLLTEVPWMSRLYEPAHEGVFLLVTGGMMLLFSLSFYIFYVRVRPALIEEQDYPAGLSRKGEEVSHGTRTI